MKNQDTSNPKVYVPQVPHKPSSFQGKTRLLPSVDLSPATQYGELVEMLPHGLSPAIMTPTLAALREHLKDFRPEVDYVLAMGDPAYIAATAAILGRKLGVFRMLRWSRGDRSYSIVKVEV